MYLLEFRPHFFLFDTPFCFSILVTDLLEIPRLCAISLWVVWGGVGGAGFQEVQFKGFRVSRDLFGTKSLDLRMVSLSSWVVRCCLEQDMLLGAYIWMFCNLLFEF